MTDGAGAAEVALQVVLRRRVLRRLRQCLLSLPRLETGAERGVHTVAVVEVEIPGLDVFEQVGEVHVRPAAEVPVADVDEAQRLEARDP